MPRVLAAILLLAGLAVAPPALADSPLPRALRSAGVTEQQWDALQTEVRATAARADISERALAAVAERLGLALAQGGRRVHVSEILAELNALAVRISELESRLAALSRDEDLAIAAWIAQARDSISAGDLDGADIALAQARAGRAERNAMLRTRLESGLAEEAAIAAAQGDIAILRRDYVSGAALYREAADIVPDSEATLRWDYRRRQAEALFWRGYMSVESTSLEEARLLYEDMVLPHAPAGEASAQAHRGYGDVLGALGERNEPAALQLAVESYQLALAEFWLANNRAEWAATQTRLGNVLHRLGERGDADAFNRATEAYQAALASLVREDDPWKWAAAQSGLGFALVRLGERGNQAALDQALLVFQDAFSVHAPGSFEWAQAQNDLGNAYLAYADKRGESLHLAINAYRSALGVWTANNNRRGWIQVNNNLGLAMSRSGQPSLAVVTYLNAIGSFERGADLTTWAVLHHNLAAAYRDLGRYVEARLAATEALKAYTESMDEYRAERARTFLARLPSE